MDAVGSCAETTPVRQGEGRRGAVDEAKTLRDLLDENRTVVIDLLETWAPGPA